MNRPLTTPLAKYSHLRRVGDLVFVAGQGCRDPETNTYAGLSLSLTGEIESYDIAAQARGVLLNIERALASAGLTRHDIVDVTVFLKNMNDFIQMNEVWNEFFKDTQPPTRTTVGVANLPGMNFVEMKAIATINRGPML